MYVYAHWTVDGHQTLQAFNKPDRAADYAYNQILNYITREERNYGPMSVGRGERMNETPPELIAVRGMLDKLKADKTVEQVQGLIDLYEEYCRHVLGQESPLHQIKDIPVVE